MKKNIKVFKNYVYTFNINDEGIIKKYNHSLRVMKLSNYLAKKLKLAKEDIYLATLIGLLHDYGRFEQWTKYKTYNDIISIDHGDLAVKLLFEDKEIKKFKLDENDYDEVYDAIKNHNKLEYDKKISKHNKIHTDIIRDTDKLDIFYIFSEGIIKMKEENIKISKKVEKDFWQKKLINREDVKTDGDELLIKLAFVFDLKFDISKEYLHKKKYIWKIYEELENKDKFRKYFEFVDNHLKGGK